MALLADIPYDILQNIFELLDKDTLLDAALASQKLNELASCWDNGSLVYLASTISLSEFLSFIEEIKLFTNTRSMEIIGGFIPRELALLLPAILALPHLNTLVLFDAPEVLKYLDYDSARHLTIHTSLYALNTVESSPFTYSTAILSFGWGWSGSDVMLLRNNHAAFTSLHTIILTHDNPIDPGSICELVSPLKRLQRLEFVCPPHDEKGFMLSCRVDTSERPPDTFQIHQLASFLRETGAPFGIRGTEFFKLILNGHVETLRTLKIPSIHPSKSTLQQLVTKSTRLSTLWIGGGQHIMTCLYDLLPLSASLVTLRIHLWESYYFPQERSLLHQNVSSLQQSVESVWTNGKNYVEGIVTHRFYQPSNQFLKVLWAYNEQEGRAVRQIVSKSSSDESRRVEVTNWVNSRILLREDEYRRGEGYWYSRARWGYMATWIANFGSESSSDSDTQKNGHQPVLSTEANKEIKEWPEADDMSAFLNQ
ncbi:14743_t:CDS:2 [Acaulospora colombiana]|uniref:14743_t:CDS:1 n=1 Tax=Acaulospora colombiana TaxID=27376 RepID=A0ACA9N036_9GLOM|nr:14743_t:CDS:2 [Acaulospora colombiana]